MDVGMLKTTEIKPVSRNSPPLVCSNNPASRKHSKLLNSEARDLRLTMTLMTVSFSALVVISHAIMLVKTLDTAPIIHPHLLALLQVTHMTAEHKITPICV